MELLAPAKNFTLAKAVFSRGADAVYFGGKKFGARAYADNLDESEILSLIDYAHIFGKKAYMTVNTLLKEDELEGMLYRSIEPLYRRGLDAVLVQDFGVFAFIKKHFPQLPIHASTQMNVTSRYGASLLKEQGASRIVLARELSIAEMAAIHSAVDVELEVFVHGALCVCYSGQCLMSSMIGGRSGNRGACGQACRLKYRLADANGNRVKAPGDYPLSPKDLCGIDDLPALRNAGVASLKIEGRMKSLSYAATVTEVYRKYLDLLEEKGEAAYRVEESDRKRLLAAGSRNGFTNAYYYGHNDTAMMAYTNSAHKRTMEEEPVIAPLALSVSAEAQVQVGNPLSVRFFTDDLEEKVCGDHPLEAARTKPTSGEEICSKLNKTGDYPFVLDEITVRGADTSFVSMKELNDIRRRAMDGLLEKILQPYRRKADSGTVWQAADSTVCGITPELLPDTAGKVPEAASDTGNGTETRKAGREETSRHPILSVRILTEEQMNACVRNPHVSEIIVPDGLWEKAPADPHVVFALPTIIRRGNADRLIAFIRSHPDGDYEADSYDGIGFLFACGINGNRIRGGMRLYAWSNLTKQAFAAMGAVGIRHLTVPVELSFKELLSRNNAGDTMRLYGRYPLMYTANCIKNGCFGCDKRSTILYLTDQKGYSFPVVNDCNNCTNIIYNSRPLSLLSESGDVRRLGVGGYELSFAAEDKETVEAILHQFEQNFPKEAQADDKASHRSADRTDSKGTHRTAGLTDSGGLFRYKNRADAFTKGHFRRGVKE